MNQVVPIHRFIAAPHRSDARAGGMRSGREHIRETKRSKLGLGRWGDVLPNAQRTIVRPLDDNDSKALASKRNGGCKAGGAAPRPRGHRIGRKPPPPCQINPPQTTTTPAGWGSI